MSNFHIDQVNSIKPNPDIANDQTGSVTVTYTEWTQGFTQVTDKEIEHYNKVVNDAFKVKLLSEAIEISRHGLSVFSTKSDKTPVIKRTNRIVELRTKLQSEHEIEIDFGQPLVAGIAINCGPVVNKDIDLECLDIDCPKLAKTFLPDLEVVAPDLHAILTKCVEETPSEGLHIFYYLPLGKSKCSEWAVMSTDNGKKWLTEAKAKGSVKNTAPPLIETRGKGGYVVGFYSQAVSKIDGLVKPYKMLHGDVSTIPTINADQHDFLMSFAESYDEKVTGKTLYEFDNSKQSDEKKAAIDQWRLETPWSEVLPESYRLTEVRPDYFYVWHPDSSGSAPNAIAGAKSGGLDRYWNFSPLDWRLPANEPLTKDYVYTQSRGLKKGDTEWNKFYSEIFGKYISPNSHGAQCLQKGPPVNLSDEVNAHYWDIVDMITPNNPENLISLLGQDLIDVCDDFETPIISRVFATSILSHIFGWFRAERLNGETKWYAITQQIILAHSCAGKNRPRRYMISLLKMLQERLNDWMEREKETALANENTTYDVEYPTFDESVSDFGSGSIEGFLEKLAAIRVRIAFIEEIVDFLEARHKKSVAEEQLTLLKKFSTPQDYVPPRDLTTNGKTPDQIKDQNKAIVNPIVNFIGFGQPERITQPDILCAKDFSGGTISRLHVFTEGDKTTVRKDGSMNIPKRRGGLPSPQVVDAIFNRVVDLIRHGGVTEIPEPIFEYLDELHIKRWHHINGLEKSKTYVPSIHGRGPEKAYSIAFLHSICESGDGWQSIKKSDIDFAFRYQDAGNIDVKKLHDLTMGSPLKRYIDEFMKHAKKLTGKELTLSTVVARWKYRGENKDKKSVSWVKETLAPELIKLELITIVNTDTGVFEVQKNG